MTTMTREQGLIKEIQYMTRKKLQWLGEFNKQKGTIQEALNVLIRKSDEPDKARFKKALKFIKRTKDLNTW